MQKATCAWGAATEVGTRAFGDAAAADEAGATAVADGIDGVDGTLAAAQG